MHFPLFFYEPTARSLVSKLLLLLLLLSGAVKGIPRGKIDRVSVADVSVDNRRRESGEAYIFSSIALFGNKHEGFGSFGSTELIDPLSPARCLLDG